MSTLIELVEELVKAERELAYAESSFDRLGRRDRLKEVDEARAALTAELSIPATLLEAVDEVLETAPCECSHKQRYEIGGHKSFCFLFDLDFARNAMLKASPFSPEE